MTEPLNTSVDGITLKGYELKIAAKISIIFFGSVPEIEWQNAGVYICGFPNILYIHDYKNNDQRWGIVH